MELSIKIGKSLSAAMEQWFQFKDNQRPEDTRTLLDEASKLALCYLAVASHEGYLRVPTYTIGD